MTEKVKPTHLGRKAILYVRQSSTYQVMHNLESQRLQYAMRGQLTRLGWPVVDVVDEDLGKSAGGAQERLGFQRMVAEVSLAQVGIVAARELSRFARNSREWQHLIEVCRIVGTLLMDEEAIYDARQSNDRLLLGLKGSMSEYELDLFRQRSQKARQQKALRGELGMNAPVGYVNAGEGRQEKDPDQRVQQTVLTVFEKFLELGTVRQVMMWFVDRGLQMPYVRCEDGQWTTRWEQPKYHSLLRILKHPIYAGAYVWGATQTKTVLANGRPRCVVQQKPRDGWLVLQQDHHEGYITWETHERIQEMIRKNSQALMPVHAGAAKRGPSLLVGLLRCGRCGKKLMVRYKGGGAASVLRYECHRGFDTNGEPRCITFGGALVDEAVVREAMRVIQPAAVEAALLAGREVLERQDQGLRALQLELEARQYEADRARRQYDAADPENRLVVAELERRWNAAMEQVEALRRKVDEATRERVAMNPPASEALVTLAQDLRTVWDDPATDARLKKRILRTLIEEVIADVDPAVPEIRITIHWKGGVHTELRVARRRAGQSPRNVPKNIVEAVELLSRICSDDRIAAWLTRNGLRTPKGNSWTRQHVSGVRHRNGVPVYDAERQSAEGWMNLSQGAVYLGVDRGTLSDALERGEIIGVHPLPVGPWLLKRQDLGKDAGQALAKRVERHRKHPGRRHPENVTPCLFSTSRGGAL